MIHSNDLSGGKKPHGDGDGSPETFAEEAPAVLQKPQVTEHPIPMTDEHDNLVVPQIEDSPPAGSYPRPPQPMAGDDSKPSEAEGKLPPKMVTSQKKPIGPSAPLPPLVPQPQGAQPISDGLPPLPPLPTVSQPQPTPTTGGGGQQPPVPGRPAGAFTPAPQPLPPEQKKELEKKAKQMVKDLDALRPKGGSGGSIPPVRRGKGAGLKYTVAGLLLMVVGAGTFFGIRLLQEQQSAEQRSQADIVYTCSALYTVGGKCVSDSLVCDYSGTTPRLDCSVGQKCVPQTSTCVPVGTCSQRYEGKCVSSGWACTPTTSYEQQDCTSTQKCVPQSSICGAPTSPSAPTATPRPSGDICGTSPADGRVCYFTNSNYSLEARGSCNDGNDPNNNSDPYGRGFGCNNGTIPMAHFVCDGIVPSGQGCGYDNGTKIFDGTGNRTFVRDCGMEQIDTQGGWISIIRNNPCGSSSQPTPTPARQNYCVSTTVNRADVLPGQTMTFTSVSNTAVNNFYFMVSNRDNLYANGTPKAVCVTSGGDNTTYQGDCPAGTFALQFRDPSTTLRTTGTRTIPYEQMFVIDRANNNQVVQRAQINGYFSLTNGPLSNPDSRCVTYVRQATAPTPTRTPTPSRTPTPRPSVTPSRTPTQRPPTATPTVPAACNSVCTTNSQCPSGLICSGGFCRNSQCTSQTNCICPAPTATLTPTLVPLACMELNYSPVQPVLGTTIDLTCVGSPLDRVERAEYQYSVNGGAFSAITNVTDLTARLFIGDPGSYTVRCRVCNGQTCTAWDTL